MEVLEIGKIYSFNVIRSDERVSIVEYDGKEFTYPKYYLQEMLFNLRLEIFTQMARLIFILKKK